MNKLIGPVNGTFGYYVFEVTRITPATQQTLAQATTQIRPLLTSRLQTSAQTAVDKHAKTHWAGKTCAARVRDGRLPRLQGAEHDDDHVVDQPSAAGTSTVDAAGSTVTSRQHSTDQ